jgi:polar amino acid transport system permease protein
MEYKWQFHVLVGYWPIFVRGAIVTLQITLGAAALGVLIGLPTGIGKESKILPIRYVCTAYGHGQTGSEWK